MQDILLLSIPLKLFYAFVAIVMLWWLARFMDRSLGIRFRLDVWEKIKDDPAALSRYFGLRILALAFVIGMVVAACSPASAAPLRSDRYDHQIQRVASTWLPGVPWKMWKAQLYQESRLEPDAVSPVGATGLAQFMPGTWDQITRELRWGHVDRRLAGPSIEAGAYYMAKLRRAWTAKRSDDDRLKLAQASYNAGMGNLLRSQQRCGNPSAYEPIMACLHLVTGRHAAETRHYVPAIWRWWALLEAG